MIWGAAQAALSTSSEVALTRGASWERFLPPPATSLPSRHGFRWWLPPVASAEDLEQTPRQCSQRYWYLASMGAGLPLAALERGTGRSGTNAERPGIHTELGVRSWRRSGRLLVWLGWVQGFCHLGTWSKCLQFRKS